jgi:hypothetical protein
MKVATAGIQVERPLGLPRPFGLRAGHFVSPGLPRDRYYGGSLMARCDPAGKGSTK